MEVIFSVSGGAILVILGPREIWDTIDLSPASAPDTLSSRLLVPLYIHVGRKWVSVKLFYHHGQKPVGSVTSLPIMEVPLSAAKPWM